MALQAWAQCGHGERAPMGGWGMGPRQGAAPTAAAAAAVMAVGRLDLQIFTRQDAWGAW